MDRQLDEALRVLGIPVGSDRETVTSAYRRLARATHPDVSPNPDAAERFATVTAAYRLVSGVPAPALHPGRHSEDHPASTGSFLRWPAPRPSLYEPEEFADYWATPPSDPGGARLLLGLSPFGPARSWRRPPLVAGPVVVARMQPDVGKRERDG
jgi:hypothetical protein